VFPIDEKAIQWLKQRELHLAMIWKERQPVASDLDGNGRAKTQRKPSRGCAFHSYVVHPGKHPRINSRTIKELEEDGVLAADRDAYYSKELTLDLSTVRPHVSG